MTVKTGDYTGYSTCDLEQAIQNALEKAGAPAYFEVIETRGSQIGEEERHYHVTITAFSD